MGTAMTVTALRDDYDARGAVELKTAIARVDGVESVDFNYTNNKLIVKFDSDRVSLLELKKIITRQEKRHTSQVNNPPRQGRVGPV